MTHLPPHGRRFTGRAVPWPLVSALVCLACQLLALAVTRTEPFGRRSVGLGDFGTQYLPFHSLLRQIVHHSPLSGAQFTWTLGTGAPVLPDHATYTSSPLTFLVTLAPAGRTELAMTWMALVKLALAAATMTFFLQRWRPRPGAGPVAALLGVAYGLSSWVVDTGFFTPQWLDAMYMLPLMFLAALWARERRHAAGAALVMGLAWWANYYTAYMATAGALLFLVAVCLAEPDGLRRDVQSVLRFLVTTGVGAALASIILLPTVLALQASTKTDGPPLGGIGLGPIAVRLLPLTEGVVSTPGICVGSVVLCLALGLPLAREASRRTRLVFTLVGVWLVVSMDLRLPVVVWNAFDDPNGNPFRYSFVVCAWIVLMAWLAWSSERRALRATTGLGLALVALLVFATRHATTDRLYVDAWAGRTALAGAVLLNLLVWTSRRPWRRVLAAVVALFLCGELVWSTVWMGSKDQLRGFLGEVPNTAHTLAASQAQADEFTRAAGWPTYRVGVPDQPRQETWLPNDPALNGYPGTSYYSTLTPKATTDALLGLGFSNRFEGRRLKEDPDPVLDMLLSVRDRAASRTADPASTPSLHPALPMVRAWAPFTDTTEKGVLANRNTLAAAVLYRPATDLTVVGPDGRTTHPRPLTGQTVSLVGDQKVTISGTCPAGSRTVAMLPGFAGKVQEDEGTAQAYWHITYVPLGRSSSTRRSITLTSRAGSVVQTGALHCLDERAAARVASSATVPQIAITPGHVTATFAAAQSGRAVVATTAIDGWHCSVGGHGRDIQPVAGLVSVDMAGGRELSCRYRAPGLPLGACLSGVAVLLLVGLALLDHRSSRRVRP